jgi:hypothetical protein
MGFEHADPEPVIIEEAVDVEPIADATVEVARIEADRDVAVAKIEARVADEELVAALAALTAENEALRAQLAPQEQQQEAVVVIADPEPEPEPVAEEAPPAVEESSEPVAKKRKSAWWG